ncbi:MAG: FtsX-like permease family protein [Planctomycetota bacterium]
MGLPLKYNIRNLKRRKMRTLLTMAGIALFVLVAIFMLAFSRGMLLTIKSTGSPDNIRVLSRKGQGESHSSLEAADYNLLRNIPEIKKNAQGEPLISLDVYYPCAINVVGANYQGRHGIVRGIEPSVFEVNDKAKITEGTAPGKGFQVMAGKLAYAKMGVPKEVIAVGSKISFENTEWTIVGKFSADGTAMESEFWVDVGDLNTIINRQTYTSATFKLNNLVDMERIIRDLNSRMDILVKAVSEQSYYQEYASGFERIVYLAIIMSLLALLGGLMNGMNTMYTAILGRIREIATLKILGFSKTAIVTSFIMESLFISLGGAIIGSLIGLSLNGIPAKLGMFAFTFRVDALVLLSGLVIALVIGVFGALIPALKATKIEIPQALRYE